MYTKQVSDWRTKCTDPIVKRLVLMNSTSKKFLMWL